MTAAQDILREALSTHLSELIDGTDSGHCVRIDDVDDRMAAALASMLDLRLDGVDVYVLKADPTEHLEIGTPKAINLRNRKVRPCLLLVPAGEGHAASSLDNSFQRVSMLEVFESAQEDLLEAIDNRQVRDSARRLRRQILSSREAWCGFLAELVSDPSPVTFGRCLWMIGLIPDLGPEPDSRIPFNRLAARAISRPGRPAASIDERLATAGIQDGPWRAPLRQFLEQQGAGLANPRSWAEKIAEERPELSFDHWERTGVIKDHLDSLEVEPFNKADGTLDKTSKLELGADGQLILRVPEDGTAPLVVKWRTDPPSVEGVAKWKLEVLPPDDLRSEESDALATMMIAGDKRRATIKVGADEDSLAQGTRFVVAISAVGPSGEDIALTSGEPATADSQEFQVVLGEAPEARARRTASPSVPEAIVRAAIEGFDDLTEDLVSWDLAGQVFAVRLGNRRSIQVRVSELIVRLQREASASRDAPKHFLANADYGSPLDGAHDSIDLALPQALRKARADFLAELSADSQRDTAESAKWTDDLRAAARTYQASYKRALDAAEGDALRDLLLLDTMSLAVRRSNEVVRATILLPIHPLRIGWISEHDLVMREWAQQLTEVKPRGARPSHVDSLLVGQVVPANLPFAVIDHEGRTAIYTEELTFGTGLYLVPDEIDTDAAAESVCSVLGLERAGSTLRASSRMVAERIGAYEAAHDPGGALRILSVSPGSGELVAGALGDNGRGLYEPNGDESEVPDDPRRLEVLCYSDSASYVRPVPALTDLQSVLRGREVARRATHLAPPMSLAVRPVERLLQDTTAAHLAVVQDLGLPSTEWGPPADRKPSFRDLLVPIVTRSDSLQGDLVWESAPAIGPAAGGAEHELVVIHRSHQRAIAKLAGAEGQVPTVTVTLDGDSQARVNAAHRRADWVIGVDRFVGVDLFETGLPDPYILDYAPDFVEGIGDRLTVTTTHRSEVERLLEGAMNDLGLAAVDQSVGKVLSTLTVVSGRLALRLLENTTLAREAVSLAALIAHLRDRGELDDLIVVPVDAHPEIFGPAARGEGEARRCDLLLVRIGQRSFKIECVEVKSRKEAKLPQQLADHIVEQLEDTRQVLQSRFFSDPPRIDAELQRARLTSLLHYYADRSANHKLIAPERIADVHRFIDRVEETGEAAEISMHGYVISLDGAHGFKKRYGDVPMTVLTADDLGAIGFTTRAVNHPLPPAESDDKTDPTPGSEADAEAEEEPPKASTATDDEPDRPKPSPVPGPEPEPEPTPAPQPDPDPDPEPESDPELEEPESDPEPETEPDPGPTDESDDGPGGRPDEAAVVLGVDNGGAPVTWRISTKGSPHAFVIGIPGQGKSVTTRKIIRDFAQQGLPSLVFDFHGDMAADPPEGSVVLNAAEGLPFSPFEPDVGKGRPINTTAWEIAEVIGYVAKLGEIQRNHVYRALQHVYAEKGWKGTDIGSANPTMEEFAAALEDVETGAAGKNARARLQPFTDFGLFAENATGRFQILSESGHGWVIDVSELGLEEVQRFAASFILRRVYREMFTWDQDSSMKLAVVLDEAHRMAKDVTLPKIMKEGRKYGVSVVVASQGIDDFHKHVLDNAGTKIVFRTNFPASKSVAGLLRGRAGLDLGEQIEKLEVGSAFVATPDGPAARKVYMAAE